MSYTAKAPEPPTNLMDFTVKLRFPTNSTAHLDVDSKEREIAEALAARFGVEVTCTYQVPF